MIEAVESRAYASNCAGARSCDRSYPAVRKSEIASAYPECSGAVPREVFADRTTDVMNPDNSAATEGTETQRDAQALERPSRITSSTGRRRFALKYCINGISVRTLIRPTSDGGESGRTVASARSVHATRIERLRPSASSTTTKAEPRPDRSPRPQTDCQTADAGGLSP